MVCTSLGSLLRPLIYFLCSNLKANPVLFFIVCVWIVVFERISECRREGAFSISRGERTTITQAEDVLKLNYVLGRKSRVARSGEAK